MDFMFDIENSGAYTFALWTRIHKHGDCHNGIV